VRLPPEYREPMHFRPFPVLTLFAIPGLAALLWLGAWQVSRAEWKSGLISDFERAATEEPVSLDDALCGPDGDPIGKVVAINEAEGLQLRVFGQSAAGQAGWRIYQVAHPACSSSTGGVLVETGFEPFQIGEEPRSAPARPANTAGKYIVEPWPRRSPFAAENAPERNEWHWFDASAMSDFLNAGPIEQNVVLAKLEGMPADLTRTPPATHIGYAVTWFGMAIALVVIYGVFHARAGRLRFGRQESGQT
jgi:surfeit locus 1 family protein